MLTKIWTTAIVLSAAASLVAWVCVAAHARGIRPLRAIARFAQKLSLAGVVVFGLMATPLYRAGSTKVGGGTNNVPPNLNQPLPQMQQGGVLSQTGFTGLTGFVGEGNPVNPVQDPITSTNTTRMLTAEDFERGFVMARVGTSEGVDFSAPSNAVVCVDWMEDGAAVDWVYVAMTNWMFKVGTNAVDSLRVYSYGKIEPIVFANDGIVDTNNWFAPFMASLGVVPEANWELLDETDMPSLVWYCITPDNALVVTWQNVLFDRDTEKPVSFQVEFFTDGRFVFRYDLSRLDGETAANFLSGTSFDGNEWTTNSLPTNVTSMAFYPLSENDVYDQDPDGDGILTIDELFVHYTDPHNADTDYDGLADDAELLVYNSDPLDPNSISAAYCDGFAAKLGDLDPFYCPEGSTNTVLEHIFYSGTTNGVFAYPTSTVETAVLKIMGGAEGIRALNPAWKDLGRVMFHLAENKQDTDGTKPFVFLATCQHKLGENGQIRHIPLGSALKTYADSPKTLLSYLEPVKAASADSPLLKRLLDENKIFKPTFFSATDAWDFLRDTETYKAAGIGVRLAGLWNNGRPKRLKVDVALDVTKKRGLLTSESLVRFSVGASLGDLKLTEAELAEILRTKGGLIRVKGEWVEAETDRVKALLERWDAARQFAGKSELSFLRALKLLSGARGLDPDEPPMMADDICAVNASPAFAEALQELTDPANMQLPDLPDDLTNILRPYQKTGVAFLWNMLRAGFGVCMADDMGLGKTLQVITALELFRRNGELADLPALAVVPASLLQNWMDECQRFAPGLKVGNLHPGALSEEEKAALEQDPENYLRRFDLVLVTYALVSRRTYLTDRTFPLILLDEAQQIKNPSSGVSRAVRSLRGERRIAITGTPVENSLSDLWSIFGGR